MKRNIPLNTEIKEPAEEAERIGYWYGSVKDDLPYALGQVIQNAHEGPPYEIVDRKIISIIVTADCWPGQLWRAQVVTLGDMSGLIDNPGYWRASAIRLLEPLPLAMLFGDYGQDIVILLQQISAVTAEQTEQLQNNLSADADSAWTKAWILWDSQLAFPRQHQYDDKDGMTLSAMGRDDDESSPVNGGFHLIAELLELQAKKQEGSDAVIQIIEDGETEEALTPKWRAARKAFLHAAMAFAMREQLSNDEYAALTAAWSSVFNNVDNHA